MRNLPAVGAIGAMAVALTGCAGSAAGRGATDDGLEIVATTTQLADITREVVGDAATVTSLLEPGSSAHAFDPGPAALSALASSDLLVISGAGLETWLDSTVEASGFAGTIVDTSEGIELLAVQDDPQEGHDHGAFDPHVWTDPANAIVQAEAVRDAVIAADPEADIAASADAYLAALEELETWMRASIEQVPIEDRLLVTTHDTFGYLERAFDVQVVGTVLPSLDDSVDVSAAHIDELVAEIRATGAPVVFSENAIDPQLAATIAREAGVELRQGEEALAVDALAAEGSPTGTYIGSQTHNTTALVTGWGAAPLPVPGSLS